MTYEAGDKVSYLGWLGTVTDVNASLDYPVQAEFVDGAQVVTMSFTRDGKQSRKHTKPSLKFISRVKRSPEKVSLYRALYYSEEKDAYYIDPRLFRSEVEAREHRPDKFIKIIATRPVVIQK